MKMRYATMLQNIHFPNLDCKLLGSLFSNYIRELDLYGIGSKGSADKL